MNNDGIKTKRILLIEHLLIKRMQSNCNYRKNKWEKNKNSCYFSFW